jgi:hypothetical protein
METTCQILGTPQCDDGTCGQCRLAAKLAKGETAFDSGFRDGVEASVMVLESIAQACESTLRGMTSHQREIGEYGIDILRRAASEIPRFLLPPVKDAP